MKSIREAKANALKNIDLRESGNWTAEMFGKAELRHVNLLLDDGYGLDDKYDEERLEELLRKENENSLKMKQRRDLIGEDE